MEIRNEAEGAQPYQVLLADDEEEVIRIIIDKMDWAGMGFQIAGYAKNGAEALELAEELQVDVVMTDIKMPYMDGLTLSRELKQRYSDIKIIIFSGFDEFEYAKEAISLEVEQYLLKPIDPAELEEVFRKLKASLDRERDERRNLDRLRKYYLQSLPLQQESFVIALIEGRLMHVERLRQLRDSLQMELNGPCFVVVIVHVSGVKEPDDVDSLLFTVQVRGLIEEQLKEKYRLHLANYLGDLTIIAQLDAPEALTELTDDFELLCRQAKRLYQVGVTAGIGTVCPELKEIRQSWREARNAVSYRAIYGNARAISISEVEPGVSAKEPWETEAVRTILKHMRMGETGELDRELEHCIAALKEGPSGIVRYRIFIMELVAALTDFSDSHQLDAEELLGERTQIDRLVFESESPEEMAKWVKEVASRADAQLQERRHQTTTSFVGRARDYVKEHFADTDVTVEAVCRYLGVSSTHFSTVFKKETGKTFISYLTDYRMERAVELLLTTADRTYLIAEKVGYADSNYFSYVFKKQFGMSPAKFRTERLSGA